MFLPSIQSNGQDAPIVNQKLLLLHQFVADIDQNTSRGLFLEFLSID
jgi:hypothetical protein